MHSIFSHILKAFQQQSKREYERCIIVANMKSRAEKKVANHLPYEIREIHSQNTAIIASTFICESSMDVCNLLVDH